MTSPLTPNWDDIPEDDSAEPDDASVAHEATVEEVDEADTKEDN